MIFKELLKIIYFNSSSWIQMDCDCVQVCTYIQRLCAREALFATEEKKTQNHRNSDPSLDRSPNLYRS